MASRVLGTIRWKAERQARRKKGIPTERGEEEKPEADPEKEGALDSNGTTACLEAEHTP